MKTFARLLVGAVAAATALAPSFYWFDQYHLGDPAWPPHARAHLVWFWLLVTGGGLASTALTLFAWERSADARRAAAAFPCLVWGACLLEAFVVSPAMGIEVPLTHFRMKVVGNTEANLFGIAAPLVVVALGLLLDRRARHVPA